MMQNSRLHSPKVGECVKIDEIILLGRICNEFFVADYRILTFYYRKFAV